MEPSEQDGVNTSNPQQYKSNWNTEGTELSFVLKIHINHQQHQVLYSPNDVNYSDSAGG